jgi:ribokinase
VTVRVAVVGHVEWVDFLVCRHLPRAGEIDHVRSAHEAPGGGGAMAALALRALTGGCTFFTAVGDDERGRATLDALRAAGLDVRAAVHPGVAQRRVVTYLTDDGERAITVLGERLVPLGADDLPWDDLAGFDAVYLTAGDADAVRAARAAPMLVMTARAREPVVEAGVPVDVIVGSRGDPGEPIDGELLAAARPRYVVLTEGGAGGGWRAGDGRAGRWAATALPGPAVDAYGCGDGFAAALTAALGAGRAIGDACALAAPVGAAVLCERAPAVGDLARLWPRS